MTTDFGIGVDIENIDRFKKHSIQKDSKLLKKIFTENELNYCFLKKDPAPYLAARFSGKEAVVKAFGNFGISEIHYHEIEIIKNEIGAPEVKINNSKFSNFELRISLAHSKDKSIAFAVAFKKN